MTMLNLDKNTMYRKISPKKEIEGGILIFMQQIKNQQNAKKELKVKIPLTTIFLRVLNWK